MLSPASPSKPCLHFHMYASLSLFVTAKKSCPRKPTQDKPFIIIIKE